MAPKEPWTNAEKPLVETGDCEAKRQFALDVHLNVHLASHSQVAAWKRLWAWLLSPANEEKQVKGKEPEGGGKGLKL